MNFITVCVIFLESLMINFQLFDTCSSLPELLEKKRLIDLHTNVATAVLEHINVNLTVLPPQYNFCLCRVLCFVRCFHIHYLFSSHYSIEVVVLPSLFANEET